MQTEAYQAFIQTLAHNLEAETAVEGLVLLGSTAAQSRAPDEWSDHDFFVITRSGAQEHFRTWLGWLPAPGAIVLAVRETAHGLKVLYDNGHLIEFAVFDLAEIGRAKANDFRVVIDHGGIRESMLQITDVASSPVQESADTQKRNLGMVPCLLLIGAGRCARGEAISGQVFIRMYALSHLLPLLAETLPGDTSALDDLDPFRRFERVFPEAGAALNEALSQPPIAAALQLLMIYERYLLHLKDYPHAAVQTVRQSLLAMQKD